MNGAGQIGGFPALLPGGLPALLLGGRPALLLGGFLALLLLGAASCAGEAAVGYWEPISVAPLDPRTGHTAVWTGTEMIVWGGRLSRGVTSTGARYEPGTDTWERISGEGPAARAGHTAIWTGTEMIVWGGDSTGSTFENTGGRYDPVEDRWAPTSTDGAPEPRADHLAVWTGTEMIVWGGLAWGTGGPGRYARGGGAYDPATDSWRPLSTDGEPEPNLFQTAVFTGSEMIVWSMWLGENVLLPVGGRYDPASDTWSPVRAEGAPQVIGKAGAVWAGAEMIVWGGGAGGRYDPGADTWRPIATGGAPSASIDGSTLWADGRLITWGGLSMRRVELTSAGGLYDAAENRWAPISSAGVVEAREKHTAVWTGTEMIVWGGEGELSTLRSGGRFAP